MDDLVEWLRAQLDEEASRAPRWHDLECEIHTHFDTGLIASLAAARMFDEVPGAVCDCGGPARVLREIDARRRIAEHHDHYRSESIGNGPACFTCGPGLGWPCPTLRALALPYADRPGYRAEWRP